jgi:hypothetical protein
MDQEAVRQILEELLGALEPIEAQSAAVVQFLKAKALATDEEFAPFLEQSANMANVRWRAVRVRAAALIAHAMKQEEESGEEKTSTQEASVESPAKQKETSKAEEQMKKPEAGVKTPEPAKTFQKPAVKDSGKPRSESKAGAESSTKKPADSKDAAQLSGSDDDGESQLSNPPLFRLEKAMGGGENKTPESGASAEKSPNTKSAAAEGRA